LSVITIGVSIIFILATLSILRKYKQGVVLELFEMACWVISIVVLLIIWIVGDVAIAWRIAVTISAVAILALTALWSKNRKKAETKPSPELTKIQESRLTVVREKLNPADEIKTLEIRFPNGERRYRRVRFCYVTIRTEGKTANDVVLYSGLNQMRLIPPTNKSTFGIDIDPLPPYSTEEFDREEELGFVYALDRDHRKVKDAIEYVHPDPRGKRVVLFFTLEGVNDRVYVPAFTKLWYNIYGGEMGARWIGHPVGIIKLPLLVTARDIEGFDVLFEVNFHRWDSFEVKPVEKPLSEQSRELPKFHEVAIQEPRFVPEIVKTFIKNEEERKLRLRQAYSRLYGVIDEIRRNIPSATDLSKMTIGTYVSITKKQFEIMEDVFLNYQDLIQNEKVMQGWREKNIKQHFGDGEYMTMQVGQREDAWFKEIESEYNKLKGKPKTGSD